MTTFEWLSPRGDSIYNYVYHENTEELSRYVGVAGVYHIPNKLKNHYRVNLHLLHLFNIILQNFILRFVKDSTPRCK